MIVATTALGLAPIVSVLVAGTIRLVPRLQYRFLNPLPFNAELHDKIESLRARMKNGIINGYLKEGKVYFTDGTVLNVRYWKLAYGYIELYRGDNKLPFIRTRGTWKTVKVIREIEELARDAAHGVEETHLDMMIAPETLVDKSTDSVPDCTVGDKKPKENVK